MPRRPVTLLCLFLVLVLTAIIAAVWYYQWRHLRQFSNQTAFFEGQALRLPEQLRGPGPIRVVHFWDPDCPCNEINQGHLTYLTRRYDTQTVKFYSVQKPGTEGRLPYDLEEAMTPLPTVEGADTLPASPAVAIWDHEGKLAYVGPYSAGMVCNSDNSFIEPILAALVAGRRVDASTTLAEGCYCPWNGDS